MSTLTVGTISEKVTDAGVAVDGVTLKDGGATFTSAVGVTGNTTITSGNLVIGTSGNGIDFSAVSNASGMTSELLDSYEEGTWTPGLTDGSNNQSGDSNTGGHYTKIGQLVFVTGHIKLDSKGSLSGVIRINGLPFATKADSNFFTRGGGSVGRVDDLNRSSDDQGIYIAVEPNVSTLDIYIDDTTNENTQLTASQIDADFRLFFSCTYVS